MKFIISAKKFSKRKTFILICSSKMTISETSIEQHCQKKEKMDGEKATNTKVRKSSQRGSAKSKAAKSALQKERRFAVLEQLRTMVGCEPGCGQFEIVQVGKWLKNFK